MVIIKQIMTQFFDLCMFNYNIERFFPFFICMKLSFNRFNCIVAVYGSRCIFTWKYVISEILLQLYMGNFLMI